MTHKSLFLYYSFILNLEIKFDASTKGIRYRNNLLDIAKVKMKAEKSVILQKVFVRI